MLSSCAARLLVCEMPLFLKYFSVDVVGFASVSHRSASQGSSVYAVNANEVQSLCAIMFTQFSVLCLKCGSSLKYSSKM